MGITKATMLVPPGQPQSNFCEGTLTGAEVNYRYDGVAPTSSVGNPIQVGERMLCNNQSDCDKIKFIRTTATSATLRLHCGVR